jgi:CO/xanthine dehydrogenase Mo-binding subunit
MADQYHSIGRTEIRKDAWDKTTGQALYTADIPLPDVRIGFVVRSPHHHAAILRIDKGEAERSPGVHKVLTKDDIPGEKVFGALIPDQPSLASDRVRHVGEPVALVIADSIAVAEAAAEKLVIDYDVLEAVFDPVEAIQPDAPKIHNDGNLVSEIHVGTGDIEQGFQEADQILDEVFYLPRISPGYMEPETSLAVWESDQTITVWVSSQHPFTDQACIAAALGMPLEKVRVKSAVIGGAFGGKEDSSLPILAALGAWAIKGKVKLVNSRRESFIAHPKRHPARIQYRLGAKDDGTITALKAEAYLDTGAYSSYGPAVAMILTETLTGSYRIPHVQIDTFVVYSNSPLSGAMRGFGSPQAHFAVESAMDMMADKLGLDPLKIRQMNILHPGDKLFTEVIIDETAKSLEVCLEKGQELLDDYRKIEPSPGKVAGVGFALAAQSMGLGAQIPDDSSHRLEWTRDGKILIHLGSPDLGQGLAMAAEQVTAEALGIPYELVETLPLDTLETPNGNVTCASRMTYLVGNALIDASRILVRDLLHHASRMLDENIDDLSYQSGKLIKKDGAAVPAVEFLGRLAEESITLSAESTFSFPYPEENTPKHLPIGMPHTMFCFGAQIVRVEVDPEIGKVEVTDFAAVHDVGRIISKPGVEGQIEGGVATGLGYALTENMVRLDDHWVGSFSEYLLPTTLDMPLNYQNIILEIQEASGPYGAKGIGEIPLVPTAPAVANAVFDAVKVRVKKLPITPERVLGLEGNL